MTSLIWTLQLIRGCVLIFLLSITGCALASQQSEYQWQRGQQHVFEYSGRLLTGIPQLASHYSGLGINATVLLDVLDQNQLQLSLENARFVKVNQRLEPRLFSQDGRDGANWREVNLPQMSQVGWYRNSQKHESTLLHMYVLNEFLTVSFRKSKIQFYRWEKNC